MPLMQDRDHPVRDMPMIDTIFERQCEPLAKTAFDLVSGQSRNTLELQCASTKVVPDRYVASKSTLDQYVAPKSLDGCCVAQGVIPKIILDQSAIWETVFDQHCTPSTTELYPQYLPVTRATFDRQLQSVDDQRFDLTSSLVLDCLSDLQFKPVVESRFDLQFKPVIATEFAPSDAYSNPSFELFSENIILSERVGRIESQLYNLRVDASTLWLNPESDTLDWFSFGSDISVQSTPALDPTLDAFERWQRWWRCTAHLRETINLLLPRLRLLSLAIRLLLKKLTSPLVPCLHILREKVWCLLHGAHPPRQDAGIFRPAFAQSWEGMLRISPTTP